MRYWFLKVEVLDVNDVVLSKLARFHSDDINDIRAMAERNAQRLTAPLRY
jgi:hypothetical protein